MRAVSKELGIRYGTQKTWGGVCCLPIWFRIEGSSVSRWYI